MGALGVGAVQMTVADVVRRLQEVDQKLIVCVEYDGGHFFLQPDDLLLWDGTDKLRRFPPCPYPYFLIFGGG